MIPQSSMYYGDDNRWFIATVISVEDPLQLGRVRIRIRGIHSDSVEDIPESDLPFAQVLLPPTEGGSSGIGTTVGLKQGAQVFGVFLDGVNSQLPLVFGSIAKIEGANVKEDELIGQTNVEKAFNFFISKRGGDYTPEQACGMIGNFLKESINSPILGDINPTALNKTEGSRGIAQWNPQFEAGTTNRKPDNRLTNLENFAFERGEDPFTLRPQLEFVKFELETELWLGGNKLRKAKTVKDATNIFRQYYERPAVSDQDKKDRITFAENTFEEMEKL